MAGPIKMWMLITSASTPLEFPDWLTQFMQLISEIKMVITSHFNLEGTILPMHHLNFHPMKMAIFLLSNQQKLMCMAWAKFYIILLLENFTTQ
jgi:hypothetical protein